MAWLAPAALFSHVGPERMGLDPQAGPGGPSFAMFFRPDQPDAPRPGIRNALVLPRPIGWIWTVNAAGQTNIAPYSFFDAVPLPARRR